MAKPYDATTKQLLDGHPIDWLSLAGLPVTVPVSPIDADLSSFSVSADKLFRVDGPAPYIAHLEPQTWLDAAIDIRALMYNSLVRWRTGLPVRSVVIFLRPEAWSQTMTGEVLDSDATGEWLKFHYKVVKVWELQPEALLKGGIGTVPLAPIAAVGLERLPEVVRQMEQRIAAENVANARELETAAYILMGLRYPRDMVKRLLEGVKHMRESDTYQAILEEGEERGEARGKVQGVVEGKRTLLLLLGGKRLGTPGPDVRAKIEGVSDSEKLDLLATRVLDVSTWEELMAPSR